MLGERRGEPSRERHVTLPSTLGRSHLSVPVRTPDTQLPLRKIDIAPLERDHLAAPQPGLTTQQHDQVRPLIDCPCDVDEPLVLLEVVERCCAFLDGQQVDPAPWEPKSESPLGGPRVPDCHAPGKAF